MHRFENILCTTSIISIHVLCYIFHAVNVGPLEVNISKYVVTCEDMCVFKKDMS